LESIYDRYNRVEYIHPDPLECVLRFGRPADQEIAGLIASAFSIGRVVSIIDVVNTILAPFKSLADSLVTIERSELESMYSGFFYRFYREEHLIGLLTGIQGLLRRHGSLRNAFSAHDSADRDYRNALDGFVSELYEAALYPPKMISRPSRGSGCKRLFLFLRWMIREDLVDPGTWSGLDRSRLLVPVDAHMLAISRRLGITDRKTGSAKTSVQITEFFRTIDPSDPVRFDFALTRLGIHPDLDYTDFPGLK
jgi:uncharacterized protein (TIGR02757 family)